MRTAPAAQPLAVAAPAELVLEPAALVGVRVDGAFGGEVEVVKYLVHTADGPTWRNQPIGDYRRTNSTA